MAQSRWSGRVFTSLCSLVSFILLLLTGLILFIEPHGRVAYWTNWSLAGLEKDQWGQVHIYTGLLFVIAGGFHLYYNWAPLIRYLSQKIETGLRHKRELVFSGLILIWVFVSGVSSLPPLVWVSDLGEAIKSAWVSSPALEPPFGHAELVSLKTLCKKQRIPLDKAMAALRSAGFTVENPQQKLIQIAESKGTSGMGVYAVIQKLEAQPPEVTAGVAWTAEKIEETFAGTGLGNKTLAQIIKELKLDSERVRQKLNRAGIAAEVSDKIKALAKKNQSTPIKVLTLMLVE